ncbi:MAG: hypothetical protein F6J95_006365 [Leptolyngbya sp. SIO1E4]|nr:hypothetical protein [Leptolyngbya sp. SIO1E4]
MGRSRYLDIYVRVALIEAPSNVFEMQPLVALTTLTTPRTTHLGGL